jgi:UDP-N-acetylglucosamine--N-acetylmuramyl-(pentapeptide) pyrophosphoryl-undecaprenol N-acetylglucosamine transferase
MAGGGTGGHLFPGIAVADALCALAPDARITFLTTDRELDTQLLGPTPYEQAPQPVHPFTLHPLRLPAFLRSWRASVAIAREAITQEPARAVLGLGGYAAGPAVIAARALGVPAAVLNPDAIPGRANRYLAKRCDRVFAQWEETVRHFPPATSCQVVGCPVRSVFAATGATLDHAGFDLSPDRNTLLVTGASQGARTINQAMARVWPEFARAHPGWQILHLTGAADEAEVRAAYERVDAPGAVRAFTHEMPAAIALADIVISRAGASTLAELTAMGKPSILLPYPYHRDMHQRANAQVLAERGAAMLLEDFREPARNALAIGAALEALSRADDRFEMAVRARSLGKTNAAEAVAGWMLEQAQSPW